MEKSHATLRQVSAGIRVRFAFVNKCDGGLFDHYIL